VLAAYERLPDRSNPHRVEQLISLDEVRAHRLAATGAIGVVQPVYVLRLSDEIEAMPSPPRVCSHLLRTLLDADVPLAGSSDAPVAPYSPLEGMRAAIMRRTAAGLPHQRAEAITPEEALRLWATGATQTANASGESGVLTPGAHSRSRGPLREPAQRPAGALRQDLRRADAAWRADGVSQRIRSRDVLLEERVRRARMRGASAGRSARRTDRWNDWENGSGARTQGARVIQSL
jgi:hypothetical protein